MEALSNFQIVYLIPALLGVGTGFIYALIFSKKNLHPQNAMRFQFNLMWIAHMIVGGIGGLMAGVFFDYFGTPSVVIFILSIVCAYLCCSNLEQTRREDKEEL